jgi:hypothetical protein
LRWSGNLLEIAAQTDGLDIAQTAQGFLQTIIDGG